MSTERLPVAVPARKYRKQVPDSHRTSLDSRIVWLWHQKYGTVQTVFKESRDVLDQTAATLIMQAILGKDLESMNQVFQRLEGGALVDEDVLSRAEAEIRV